jgi:hypothetical protein
VHGLCVGRGAVATVAPLCAHGHPRDCACGEEATTHSGNYILADEEGRQLERSFPQDKLFVISKDDIAFTRRQAQLYSRDEWMDARVTVSEVQAGPLPVNKDPAGSGAKSDQTWWAVERVVWAAISPRGVKEVKVKWVGYDEPES